MIRELLGYGLLFAILAAAALAIVMSIRSRRLQRRPRHEQLHLT